MEKIIATIQNMIDCGIILAAFFLFAASVMSYILGIYSEGIHGSLIMLSSALLLHLAIKSIGRWR